MPRPNKIPPSTRKRTTLVPPPGFKDFQGGQLCYVVWRRFLGKGPYRLLLHEAQSNKYSFGSKKCWTAVPFKGAKPS
jgi:hypothetical protein